MKALKLIFPVLLVTGAMIFTSCGKDEDPPSPAPVVNTQPPAPTTSTDTYVKGSGWGSSNVNLKVTDQSNNQIFWNNIGSTTATFTINLDETYNYEITYNIPNVTVTGTYGISSTTGVWFVEDGPQGVIGIVRHPQNSTEIIIYKI
jgi:hypothetical protein